MWSELHRIEFYGRVSWHTKWTDEVRKLYHVNVYSWEVEFLKGVWSWVRSTRIHNHEEPPAENHKEESSA